MRLAKWLEEGLAEHFSTSRFRQGKLALGHIDPNTYPVWWIDELAKTPSVATNINEGSVIPLRAIVSGSGGPSMNRKFNLYYLHWWSLTHFIFQTPKYRNGAFALLKNGGGLREFEQQIGPVEQVQTEWHDHVQQIKAALAGNDLKFFRTGELPQTRPR